METLRCSKNSFHAFAEKQNWLLLFDKVNDLGSEISYMLSNGNTLFVVFDIDGYFDHMNDTCNATIGINTKEDTDEP
jgi:hypothetical protein